MAQELTLRPAGLWSDPSPLAAAPPGALVLAQNVQFKREGIAEPRPGFEFLKIEGAPGFLAGYIAYQIIPYDNDVFAAVRNSVGPFDWKLIRQSNQTEILDEAGASLDFIENQMFFAEHRGNLYITCSDGIRKMSSATDATAPWAGVVVMPPPGEIHDAVPSLVDPEFHIWLPVTESVAYRVVLKREDSNGYIRRGPPSGRRTFTNDSIALPTTAVRLTITLPTAIHLSAGDVIEIYRTRTAAAGVDPGDTMFLAKEHVLTAANIAGGSFQIVDDTEQDDLGASLYSNETQQGILQSNYNPPVAKDVALYAGMMFYANVQTTQRFTATLNVSEFTGDGFGTRHYSTPLDGDFLIATPNVTVVAPARQASVNQLVVDSAPLVPARVPGDPGDVIPAGTLVTNIVSTTAFDMSNNAIITANNHQFSLSEKFATDAFGAAYSWFDEALIATFPRFQSIVSGVIPPVPVGTVIPSEADLVTQSLAFAFSTRRLGVVAVNNANSITLEQEHPSGIAFEVYASHGESWTPNITRAAIPAPNSSADIRPNRVFYSKSDEPEAVPIVNYFDVGAQEAPILRIVVARDSLLVFKTDGIFRISGTNPFDLRLDELDVTAKCIHPKAIAPLGNRVYTWTDQGVIAASDIGVVQISDPAIQNQLSVIEQAVIASPSTLAVFACGYESENYFIMGVPPVRFDRLVVTPTITEEWVDTIYVFNEKTSAWSTWTPDHNGDAQWGCAQYNPAQNGSIAGSQFGDRLLLGGQTGFPQGLTPPFATLFQERKGQANAHADYELAVTVLTATGGVATINPLFGGYFPVTGDAIFKGAAEFAIVTNVTNATTFEYEGTLTPGAGTWYVAFRSSLKFTTQQDPNAGVEKHWRDSAFLFESLAQFFTGRVYFDSDRNPTADNIVFEQAVELNQYPKPVRMLVTRNQARASRLGVQIDIEQATSLWKLSGLSLIYELMNERVRYR